MSIHWYLEEDQLRHHIWVTGNSRLLEENRVVYDMKVKMPKWEPWQSLFMAVKLALRSVEMAPLQCSA